MTEASARSNVAAGSHAKFGRRQMIVPDSDARPFTLSSFTPDPFMVNKGFPDRPPLWVDVQTLVSATGEYLLQDRLDPTDVIIPCHSRFIANDATWDPIAGTWNPSYTQGLGYSFVAPAGFAPNLQEVSYRIGKEVITGTALTFTPGDVLSSDFNSGIDDAVSFSVVMVAVMHAPLGYTLLSTPPDEPRLSIEVTNRFTLTAGTRSASDILSILPTQAVPVYVVLSVKPPVTSMWIATGPNKMWPVSIKGTDAPTTAMKFQLGQGYTGTTEAWFDLMEFSLWDYPLQRTEDDRNRMNLAEAISHYSSIYGAH